AGYLASDDRSAPQRVKVYSLGPFEVYAGARPVDEQAWKTRKVRYLFAFLLAHGERPVSEDLIIEEFWPGESDRGRKNLYGATSTLRKVLAGDSAVDPVLRMHGRLQINPVYPVWHDMVEFEAAIQASKQPADRCRALNRCVRLYRGPYLDGCYMDWAIPLRTRIERQVEGALFELARHAVQEDRTPEACEHASRILEIDPCNQAAHLILMQAHLRSGRPEAAVRQFEQCRQVLRQELRMEPTIELLEAYHRARLSLSEA
ncbi:MAG: BTAD domain-containing putative transcriptional regulator, partial [Candidatus Eremiobacterota bacterium]